MRRTDARFQGLRYGDGFDEPERLGPRLALDIRIRQSSRGLVGPGYTVRV
jgi:hypothetical protein